MRLIKDNTHVETAGKGHNKQHSQPFRGNE